MPLLYNIARHPSNSLANCIVDITRCICYNNSIQTQKEPQVDELKIRFDQEENKYYVYFNGPFGQCAYQSEPFDTLFEAEAFKQDQEDSAGEEE